jgi:hypothetical protein
MLEAQELFEGWADHPPTNLLVKAIVEGFGGGKPSAPAGGWENVPPEALAEANRAMQNSALQQIAVKAGPTLPIQKGRDRGLPKAPPIFDEETMRQRNEEARARIEARRMKGVRQDV